MHYYPGASSGYSHCRNTDTVQSSTRSRRHHVSSRRELDMVDSGDSALSDLGESLLLYLLQFRRKVHVFSQKLEIHPGPKIRVMKNIYLMKNILFLNFSIKLPPTHPWKEPRDLCDVGAYWMESYNLMWKLLINVI